MAVRHVVLFRMYDECSEEEVDEMVDRLRALGAEPGILEWRIERSLDERKGRIIVEDSVFESVKAIDAFRVSDAHAGMAYLMAQRADWWIGDYQL